MHHVVKRSDSRVRVITGHKPAVHYIDKDKSPNVSLVRAEFIDYECYTGRMKRIVFICTLTIALGVFLNVHAEEVRTFDATIRINEDSSLQVTEAIVYDFGELDRHGIYRTIPVKYRDNIGNYAVRISDVRVTDEDSEPWPFAVRKSGTDLEIKVGDPDALITGTQTYVIQYTVQRAVIANDASDELYWNVTGTEWTVPIRRVSTQVILPSGVPPDRISYSCYQGRYGSPDPCMRAELSVDGEGSAGSVSFASAQLGTDEGLTVDVQIPKELIAHPSALQEFGWFVEDNWYVAVPVAVFVVMFYLWRTRGRDPKGRGTIIAQYEPPKDMTPAEVGTVYDEKVQIKDIAAEIIQLAIAGFISIRQEDKKFGDKQDYTLLLRKEGDDSLAPFEQSLLKGLFSHATKESKEAGLLKEAALSDLKYSFQKELHSVRSALYRAVVAKGYFASKPQSTRIMYAAFGVAVFCLAFVAWVQVGTVVAGASFVVSGIIIVIFSFIMPKRTYQGVLAREHILGFREYLTVVEKDRLKFHNAPEKKPETFMQWLAYAMVLGVEKQWADQFKDMALEPPSWYQGAVGSHVNSLLFVRSLSGIASSVRESVASRPSSAGGGGGGGFSGGGFGGGGGGSW